MIYAIGKVDHKVRMLLETDILANATINTRPDEVCFSVPSRTTGTIFKDPETDEYFVQPEEE